MSSVIQLVRIFGITGFSEFMCTTYCAERFLVAHQIDDEGGARDEEDLHEGVVERDVVHEQIEIPHTEDEKVQFLSFARETYRHVVSDSESNLRFIKLPL